MSATNQNPVSPAIASLPIGTGILAFRDLPAIIKNNKISVGTALDFGCGSGRTSRFLKDLGFKVHGVDIDADMINKAKASADDIQYDLIKVGDFSNLKSLKYDLILIAFVLMEIADQNLIINNFIRLKKLLNNNGKIMLIAPANGFYQNNWLSIRTGFAENKNAVSGEIVKVFLKDYNIEIQDYLWQEKDYLNFFAKSNLSIVNSYKPLGMATDNKPWLDEYSKPPFVTYVLADQDSASNANKKMDVNN